MSLSYLCNTCLRLLCWGKEEQPQDEAEHTPRNKPPPQMSDHSGSTQASSDKKNPGNQGSPSNTTVSSTPDYGSVPCYQSQFTVKDMLEEANREKRADFAKKLGAEMNRADAEGRGEAIRARHEAFLAMAGEAAAEMGQTEVNAAAEMGETEVNAAAEIGKTSEEKDGKAAAW